MVTNEKLTALHADYCSVNEYGGSCGNCCDLYKRLFDLKGTENIAAREALKRIKFMLEIASRRRLNFEEVTDNSKIMQDIKIIKIALTPSLIANNVVVLGTCDSKGHKAHEHKVWCSGWKPNPITG